MLSVCKEMKTFLEACGKDNIFENAPFQKESKERMIEKEFDIIRSNPYVAGRWLEACHEDAKSVSILEDIMHNLDVSDHGIWILENYNDFNKQISDAVLPFNEIVLNAFKVDEALGIDATCLPDEEKAEVVGNAFAYTPDRATVKRTLDLLSDTFKDMADDFLNGDRDNQEDSNDLVILALAIDVRREPLEWMSLADLYKSKKFGTDVYGVADLKNLIGGHLNA